MKVAFDVQGTLEGRSSPRVVRLFRAFAELGCDMYVWSFGGRSMARDMYVWSFGGGSMARDTIDGLCLNSYGKNGCRAMSKRHHEGGPVEDRKMDLCIDDDSRTAYTLDSKKVLTVGDIPKDEQEIINLAKTLYDSFYKG